MNVDVDLVEVGSGDSGSPRNQSGVCCNNCSTETFDGFPSIKTRTFELPLMLISLV